MRACRYTHTELLSGDNAYSCEKCKQNVEAERRLCFEVAPNTLQICLKRFVSVGGLESFTSPPGWRLSARLHASLHADLE